MSERDLVRPAPALRRTHDLLGTVLEEHVATLELSPDEQRVLEIILGTLCYVLQHEGGARVAGILSRLNDRLAHAGWRLGPAEQPVVLH